MKKGLMIVGVIAMFMVMPTVVNASNEVTSSTNGSMIGTSAQQVKAIKQTPKVETVVTPVVEPTVAPVIQQTIVPTTSNNDQCPYGNDACNQTGACVGQCPNADGYHHEESSRHDGMGHRGGQGYHNGNHH